MADVTVGIDPATLEEWASDWDSPIGQAVANAVEVVEDEAKIIAPVSRAGGSPLAPAGFLKASVRAVENTHHDADGHVMGLVATSSYPYGFISTYKSRAGYTRNVDGTVRPATQRFLEDAIRSAPFQTWRV
jgi:hypothetical protein